MSAVPGFFQINEPVIFGNPVVMNPILFLPFVFAPVINATIAYFAIQLGFVGMKWQPRHGQHPPLSVLHGVVVGRLRLCCWSWFTHP